MEFQAYPSMTDRKGVRAFLRLQGMLHGTDSVALPATLLLVVGSLAAHQHLTHPDTHRYSVRNFLVKVLLSMVPLVALERQIFRCSDPVGLFSKFSVKVLLMHASFLGLRMATLLFDVELAFKEFNIVAFILSCVLLPALFGMRLSLACIREHRDVLLLVVVSLAIALLEVSIFTTHFRWHSRFFRSQLIQDIIMTGSDYIELLAFVPAVWMSTRGDGTAADTLPENVATSQKRALGLFGLMVAFYSVEDLAHAVDVSKDMPAAALGHIAHFLLILDFAGFLIAHLCDPSKFAALKGAFVTWVSDVCGV